MTHYRPAEWGHAEVIEMVRSWQRSSMRLVAIGAALPVLGSVGWTVLTRTTPDAWWPAVVVAALGALPAVVVHWHHGHLRRQQVEAERAASRKLLDAVRSLAVLDQAAVIRRTADAVTDLLAGDVTEIDLGRKPYGDQAAAPDERIHRIGRLPDTDIDRVLRTAAEVVVARLGGDGGSVRVYYASRPGPSDRAEADLETIGAAAHTALLNAGTHARLAALVASRTYDATHDPVTSLPNRRLLIDRMRDHQRATADQRFADPVAVVLLQVADLGEVSRELGQEERDQLIRPAARRLRQATSLGELVARVDAHQFAVYFHEAPDLALLRRRAESLLAALAEPVRLEVGMIGLIASAGVAYGAPGSVSPDELLRQAAVANDHNLAVGTQVSFYRPEIDSGGPQAMLLIAELHDALQENQLLLLYQPAVDLVSGAPVAVEATVIWAHPVRGTVDGGRFLPVLEHTGLLGPYTDWLLCTALTERARWQLAGVDVPVAINLPTRSLYDRELCMRVAGALIAARVPADQLILELTEAAVLCDTATVDTALEDLRALGVRIAIDDFDTGWSPSRLLQAPVTDLKIAAKVASGLPSSASSRTIVGAALEIARVHDLRVTATGISSAGQAAAMRGLGAHAGQGDAIVPASTASRALAAMIGLGPPWESSTADVIPLQPRRG
jgi:diguanylate cyclase